MKNTEIVFKMTNYLFAFTIITAVLHTSSKHVDTLSAEDAEYSQNNVELMMKIEKENIRSKILRHFGRDEPPAFTKSLTRLSDDAIQMLIGRKKEEPTEEVQNDSDEMFFFPVNSKYTILV